jgi:hypothetical protein
MCVNYYQWEKLCRERIPCGTVVALVMVFSEITVCSDPTWNCCGPCNGVQ